MNDYTYVDNILSLSSLEKAISHAQRVSLDTEADSLYHYYEKVCLIQVTIRTNTYILDPLVGLDLSNFFALLSNKQLILHSADYDLRILRASYGFSAGEEIFDTMLAAQFLGHKHLGLSSLLKCYFGIHLSKDGQKFNWSLRPLPKEKLIYAGNDTRYLEALAEKMEKELSGLGRLDWHKESCAKLVRATLIDRPDKKEDSLWRIKGLKGLNRQQLALVRALWYWREDEAKKSDLPPFKILENSRLLKLSLWIHSHPGSPLSQGPKLPRNCKGERFQALLHKIKETLTLTPSEWPQLSAGDPTTRYQYSSFSEKESSLFKNLRKRSAEIAFKLGLPPSVLISRSSLEAIIRSNAITVKEIQECGKITHWQAEIIAPSVKNILSGL